MTRMELILEHIYYTLTKQMFTRIVIYLKCTAAYLAADTYWISTMKQAHSG